MTGRTVPEMDAESNSQSAKSERRSVRNSTDAGEGRQVLLEEARTTTDKQLAQLNKLDDEAVRTVRNALLLLGLVVGSGKFLPLPDLGLLGLLGTISLVGSLVTSSFVYGTTSLFLGPTPEELPIDYTDQPRAGNAYRKVIDRYDSGLLTNRYLLVVNGFIFGISRLLLALSVVLFVTGLGLHVPVHRLSLLHETLSIVEFNY